MSAVWQATVMGPGSGQDAGQRPAGGSEAGDTCVPNISPSERRKRLAGGAIAFVISPPSWRRSRRPARIVGGGSRFCPCSGARRRASFNGEIRLESAWPREVRANWAIKRRKSKMRRNWSECADRRAGCSSKPSWPPFLTLIVLALPLWPSQNP
jgi:hypothetical protein